MDRRMTEYKEKDREGRKRRMVLGRERRGKGRRATHELTEELHKKRETKRKIGRAKRDAKGLIGKTNGEAKGRITEDEEEENKHDKDK